MSTKFLLFFPSFLFAATRLPCPEDKGKEKDEIFMSEGQYDRMERAAAPTRTRNLLLVMAIKRFPLPPLLLFFSLEVQVWSVYAWLITGAIRCEKKRGNVDRETKGGR